MQYAFDIGGSKIEFGVFDGGGDIRSQIKVPTPAQDRDAFVAAIAGLIADADGEFGENADIGISFAGGLDPQTGAVISANIPAIKGWPFGPELSRILNRDVRVANDADCFALAEARSGAAKGARTVFAIILGTGVGGGIVVDGQFIGGRSGIRGEWGHGNDVSGALIRHGLAPVVCGCGRTGCLDAWGGARGLERIYAQIAGLSPRQERPSYEITDGWQGGDAMAGRAVEIFVDLIAGELALMVNVLDPDCVPVGGGLASESRLIAMIDDAVRKRVLGRYDAPLVVPGQHSRDGGLRGAAMLHLLDGGAGV
ncbi:MULTISPECIES: ROK family protein [Thalassospira]|jgi:N-acetylglucosamine kinase|uniref:ROK family protein n=1 Tax=Thalassospira TaxID=168934 RepID=UPI00080FBB19|nr:MULTISPECIES: ROK family protein [Thalassospira]MAB35315.1 sugar kinase [Thalassospira sp.]MBA06030.1 sugar kinase [Thalassospira sp.]MDM7974709.1 ROK family protein [Thalassospira xiamenensis]OCK06297.1 N-acetylglucosamine kinase [Thalassospira sp. KO164]OHZ02245.1 sugar kinase [Thalassospira sp. MIT1004]|tara:strand:+ start:8328 stop:9260 length:933 start_codon:yes stop_codon:yes gene_type:complete